MGCGQRSPRCWEVLRRIGYVLPSTPPRPSILRFTVFWGRGIMRSQPTGTTTPCSGLCIACGCGDGGGLCPADRQGRLDYEAFERLLRPNTKVVVCTHGSNLTGNVLDVERVGAFCRDHGLLFVLDASQTAGPFPIDMERQHIDVVCFTGHKSLLGPQGTGGLCVGNRSGDPAAAAGRHRGPQLFGNAAHGLSHPSGGRDPQ